MILEEIRNKFLSFFEEKGHTIVPSAPMVIKDDPTLMFTNAGMVPFKEFFLGNAIAKDKRVTDTQKCLRVSGKHNDLDEVGVDTYHHTMFEMLGNWSFGDYFKEESIAWAWELLTEVYGIDKNNLYVTIFEGDEKDGVPRDTESYDFWKKWIAEDRIIEANKDDNFWEMGEMGPCGPCSEIHVDIRSDEEKKKVDGKTLVNKDHPQVIEVWNLVFIQFNRKADASLEKLPETHIDTGMGLERLAMVLQGVQSNYDIDLFQKLIGQIVKQSGFEYGKTETTDIALRVIADHVRAIAFSISDGQLPSNTGAGYVIRRILRRAVRYGYQTLKMNEPFLAPLSKVLIQEMGEAFPELVDNKTLIENVIREEELSFFKTLEQGIKRIEIILENQKAEGIKQIPGEQVFELYDTFGFPYDLTELMAREAGMTLDQAGFDKALKVQKDRSRSATSLKTDDWTEVQKDDKEEFIGYDHLEADVKITRYRKVEQNKKTFYQLVFNLTPFYPEGGGQVGDKGHIEFDGEKISVFDTKKENNLIVHLVKGLPKNPSATFKAVVNSGNRALSAANHSATHLLHHALRTVLGDHVVQKGSLVNPEYLRFDFSHFSRVSEEELIQIEQIVNDLIRQNAPLNEMRDTPIKEAQELGATMLFGEKYGDTVRVIQFGDSMELCGGTHVQGTGNIGWFKIISEGSVASGIRRIEAISSQTAEQYINNKLEQLSNVNALFKNTKNVVQSVEEILESNNRMQKQLEKIEKERAKDIKADLKKSIVEKDGMNFIEAIVPLDGGAIKDVLFQLKGEVANLFAVIGGESDGKCTLTVIIDEALVKAKDLHAGNIIRSAAKHIQGGGGGQPFFATAGGKKPEGLKDAIAEVKALI
ncbi:alanine--tRNA ligase [Brumimicrobium glaciale]|uniref:Alanine--tRNA ligase n=1 Tax=Brumimicrobium glaciale TaxID=200475 RepID=A0A4Q4KKT9_9FLAO|nr:alanine--tRNA ligase [Brumimicrobium glaciale]RYM33932.1 alanine--tRNA ligase [Brumimicrobium glaciale]